MSENRFKVYFWAKVPRVNRGANTIWVSHDGKVAVAETTTGGEIHNLIDAGYREISEDTAVLMNLRFEVS